MSEKFFANEEINLLKRIIESQHATIETLKSDITALTNSHENLKELNEKLSNSNKILMGDNVQFVRSIQELKEENEKKETAISKLADSVLRLDKLNKSLLEENKQLKEGRDFLTKALDNAANIETRMAAVLKDQRQRIDTLEREINDLEANEEKHHIQLMELRNELTITRDAYWYLKEKSGQ